MNYSIKDPGWLKKLLWADTILGGTTAITGICFLKSLDSILGLTRLFILYVSVITLCYAIVALILASQKKVFIPLLRILIYANWAWTIVSVILLFIHFDEALLLGKIFLVLQIIVVGGLAWLEGRQLVSKK
jgi:hypothetical protein